MRTDNGTALMRWAAEMFWRGRVDRRIELWFRLTSLQSVEEIGSLRRLLSALGAEGMHAQVMLLICLGYHLQRLSVAPAAGAAAVDRAGG